MSTERRFANIGHDHDGTYLPLTAGATYPLSGDLWLTSGQPNIWLTETDQAADTKVWRFVASGGVFYAQIFNDALGAASTWLTVSRSTHTSATSITFDASSSIGLVSPYVDFRSTATTFYGRLYYSTTSLAGYLAGNSSGVGFLATDGNWSLNVSGSSKNVTMYANLYMTGSTTGIIFPTAAGIQWDYPFLGRTYSNASTVLGNNIYVDAADAVSGQVRTKTTHASYGHTIYEMYAGAHYWYGNNNSVTATAVVTKVLRMTLDTTGSLICTQNLSIPTASVLYFDGSGGTKYIRSTAGSYSSITVAGSNNGYTGIRFDSSNKTANLMFQTGSALWGVYVETGARWDMLYNTTNLLYLNGQADLVSTATLSSWGTSAKMTRSTAAASGGTDGDIHFRTGASQGLWINIAGTWTVVAT